MSQYSAAAYCKVNINGRTTRSPTTCSRTNNCPLVEEAGLHSNLESENVSFNHIHQLIILGFSSSISWANWLSNLNLDNEDSDLSIKCKVYSRWYKAWSELRDCVLWAVLIAVEA